MLLYETELKKLKDIYEHLKPAHREMVRPILAMPLVVMGVFGLVLIPFGVLNLLHVLGLGLLAAGVAAAIIWRIVDVKKELELYRARMQKQRPVTFTAANDPAAAVQKQQTARKTKAQ